MDFFISFFLSPWALMIYGFLALKLVSPLFFKNGMTRFKAAMLIYSCIAIILSVVILIACQRMEPYWFHEYTSNFFCFLGDFLFGLLLLLCLWGFKRTIKSKDNLFENIQNEESLQEKSRIRFKLFAFSVYFVVSLVGFVVSENYRHEFEQRIERKRTLRIEYESKLSNMRDKMQEVYISDSATREQYNAFSDSLSIWSKRYREVDLDNKYISLIRDCEDYLVRIEMHVIRSEELTRRYNEKNAEFISELQNFLALLPDKLNKSQYEQKSEDLQFLYGSYDGFLYSYAEATEFSAEAIQMYEQCQQELESRREGKK